MIVRERVRERERNFERDQGIQVIIVWGLCWLIKYKICVCVALTDSELD